MRMVIVGTGPFAVPTFRALLQSHHEIIALVTSPLRQRKRGKKPPVPPMRDVAHEFNIPIHDPENINSPEAIELLAGFEADLLIVCDYGQILSIEALATAALGGINLHGSLLPRYRGAAPINWALYNGETETGVTVIHMTPQIDAGPCIAQAPVEIAPEETAVELEERLSDIGAWLVRQSIQSMEEGRLEALPQNPALTCNAPRLKKTDGRLDWSRTAEQLKNQIRAMEPWPKNMTTWQRPDGKEFRLILGPVSVEPTPEKYQSAQPGTVVEAADDRLAIVTGDGLVVPRSIQPTGKKMMPIDAFLRGYRVESGERFE